MSDKGILLGVPKVEYGKNGITPFPMCLKACANYLGRDISYDYVMAASGAAFRLTWDEKAWNCGNVDVIFAFDDPSKVYQSGIESLGCEYNLLGRTSKTKKSDFINFIKSKIDIGIPCIALGIIGPPEACIITGYRDDGNVLLGWSFFQDNPEFAGGVQFDESGYFITDKWWENPETKAIMSLSETVKENFSPKTILRNALQVLAGRKWKHYAKGIMAYDAWARAISNNNDFSESAILPLLAERLMCHGDAMDCIADGRHNAAVYMKRLASEFPEHQKLFEEVIALFCKASSSMGKIAEVLGGWQRGENQMRIFAKPGIRKQVVKIIFEAKDADEKVLEILKTLADIL